jgi:hypothetical protein
MPDPTTPLSNFPMGDPAEDIFEETDATTETPAPVTNTMPVGGGTMPPSAPRPTANPTMVPPRNPLAEVPGAEVPKPKRSGKMIMLLVVLLLVVVLAGGAAYYFLVMNKSDENSNTNNSNSANTNLNSNINNNTNQVANVNSTDSNANTNQNSGDTDGDGLLDSEERELGTSIQRPDSDSDELFDYEEVKVYKTDPLNPDTDGDTFLDGKEVKAGYDPNGPGKLLDIEDGIKNINQSN